MQRQRRHSMGGRHAAGWLLGLATVVVMLTALAMWRGIESAGGPVGGREAGVGGNASVQAGERASVAGRGTRSAGGALPLGATAKARLSGQTGELVISVAASLAPVMQAIAERFEAQHSGSDVHINTGSSGALLAQILHGAPADVYMAADPADVQRLEQAGLTIGPSRVIAGNRIVLVRPAPTPSDRRSGDEAGPHDGRAREAAERTQVEAWARLAGPEIRRLAIGNPNHVPVGRYARSVLKHLGLWERVQDKLVLGEDARQVLAYVARGEVDAGIVYASDAQGQPRVSVVAAAPPGSHTPVTYVAATVRGSRHPELAAAWMQFLSGPTAQELFRAYGFEAGP